jgi:hypothetical protein
MPTSVKYPYTQWVNGMKLSKEHFIGLENSFIDHLRDMAAVWLSPINFGLLPAYDGRDSLAIEINPERLEIRRCQAITPGGVRIDIPDNHQISSLKRPMHEIFTGIESKNTDWYVMLKVNPFQRNPYGPINNEENPPRHPWATPSYELSIVSQDQVNPGYLDPFSIPVARITDNYGGKRADERYIPPCTGVQSYSLLMEHYHRFSEHVNAIEDSLFEIIKKTQKKRADQRGNMLATDIESISVKIIDYISLHKDSYELLLIHQPPVYMIEWFSRMARVIKSALRFLNNMDGMLNYFNLYVDKGVATDFLNVMEKTCSIHYNHSDAQNAFDQIGHFLSFLSGLFKKLRELKFEEFADPTIIEKMVYNPAGQQAGPVIQQNKGARSGGIVVRPKGAGAHPEDNPGQDTGGWGVQ